MRRSRRFASQFALVLLAGVLGVAGCGGDEGDDESTMSADEYSSALDSACQEVTDELLGLPQRAQDESLEIEEVRQIAAEAGDQFLGTVESLSPPAELQASHEELLAISEEGAPSVGDPDEIRGFGERLVDVYAELGASGCESLQSEALARLPEPAAGGTG